MDNHDETFKELKVSNPNLHFIKTKANKRPLSEPFKPFETYKREYRLFRNSERTEKLINNSQIQGLEQQEYDERFKTLIKESNDSFFKDIVRHSWLALRYKQGSIRRKRLMGSNGMLVDEGFATYMRQHLGHQMTWLLSSQIVRAVCSYFNEFFPDFYNKDPFVDESDYKFPFEHVSIDHLALVHQMPERLELLGIAEKEKMSFYDFFEYVLNYILCFNDKYGEDVYEMFVMDKYSPTVTERFPHVKNKYFDRHNELVIDAPDIIKIPNKRLVGDFRKEVLKVMEEKLNQNGQSGNKQDSA